MPDNMTSSAPTRRSSVAWVRVRDRRRGVQCSISGANTPHHRTLPLRILIMTLTRTHSSLRLFPRPHTHHHSHPRPRPRLTHTPLLPLGEVREPQPHCTRPSGHHWHV